LTKTALIQCFIFQSKGAWSFVCVAKPTKALPRGDGTEYR